ncbi:MAG: TIGR03089 family protein, partial [Mycobacterium sp.]
APDLPVGVIDYATAVRVHGDQVVAERHPGPALAGRSVDEVLAACQRSAQAKGLTAADRVLSVASWDQPDELIAGLLAVLAVGASLVQVANPDPAALPRRMETEKVTVTVEVGR